jgi:hypothetical protein
MKTEYTNYRYFYPPRPETKSTPASIPTYERMGFYGQPKLNGSCAMLYTNGIDVKFMGRHADTFTRQLISKEDLAKLHRGSGWMCLCGEFLNKSKKDSNNKTFDAKFVIFDILILDGKYLLNTTFEERLDILDTLYTLRPHDKFIDKINDYTFRVKTFKNNLKAVYDDIVTIDMYEGLVCKKANGKLEDGLRPNNNRMWQIKMRKPTKNYNY